MASWRDPILTQFPVGAHPLTLVADPDDLLLDEQILETLSERGYELTTVEDPIAFRFLYESRYRAAWDRGATPDRDLIVRAPRGSLAILPWDLRQKGRTITLGLASLFPNLQYSVVAALDRSDLDALWAARGALGTVPRGDRATRDLALRYVFGIDLGRIRNPSDLLALLLRLHRDRRILPTVLQERFLALFREQAEFADWPLDQILPRRDAFLAFLQERWPVFLQQIDPDWPAVVRDAAHAYAPARSLEYPGPVDLPFDDSDVRPEIQALFLDGTLQAIAYAGKLPVAKQWVKIGIRVDPEAERIDRLTALVERLYTAIPPADARYSDWLAFAYRWARLVVLENAGPPVTQGKLATSLQDLRSAVDAAFLAWVEKRYGGLYSQPPLPVIVSHVPRALAALRSTNGGRKIALIVMDGMAIDQWLVLRERLNSGRPDLRFDEAAAFAWVPTITSVSRQAIFAGRAPAHFPSSILRTDSEPNHWRSFWQDAKLSSDQVGYLVLPRGEVSELGRVEAPLADPRLQVLGLVVGAVDRLAHGSNLGKAGLHQQVRLWAEAGFFAALLDRLFDAGWLVVLTADHGNVEALGSGRSAEGSIASTRGERARVYPSATLRDAARARYPEAISWPPLGLPEDFYPLMAPGRCAFTTAGERIVGHGGINLEEVIVPYVVIRRERS